MNHAPVIVATPALIYSTHWVLVVWIIVAHFHLCSLPGTLSRYTVLQVWAVRRPMPVCCGSQWGWCVLFILHTLMAPCLVHNMPCIVYNIGTPEKFTSKRFLIQIHTTETKPNPNPNTNPNPYTSDSVRCWAVNFARSAYNIRPVRPIWPLHGSHTGWCVRWPVRGLYGPHRTSSLPVCINHAPATPATPASVWTCTGHIGCTGLNIQHAPAVSFMDYCYSFSPL